MEVGCFTWLGSDKGRLLPISAAGACGADSPSNSDPPIPGLHSAGKSGDDTCVPNAGRLWAELQMLCCDILCRRRKCCATNDSQTAHCSGTSPCCFHCIQCGDAAGVGVVVAVAHPHVRQVSARGRAQPETRGRQHLRPAHHCLLQRWTLVSTAARPLNKWHSYACSALQHVVSTDSTSMCISRVFEIDAQPGISSISNKQCDQSRTAVERVRAALVAVEHLALLVREPVLQLQLLRPVVPPAQEHWSALLLATFTRLPVSSCCCTSFYD